MSGEIVNAEPVPSEDQTPPPRPPVASRIRTFLARPLSAGLTGVAVGLLIGLVSGSAIAGTIATQKETEQAEAAKSAEAEAMAARTSLLGDAVDTCGADEEYAVVGDGGLSLTIDNKGKEDYLGGLSSKEMWCVIVELGAPTSATSHMEQTTSMDGRQTESWDDIEISWSYHPDRGMDSVIEVSDQ